MSLATILKPRIPELGKIKIGGKAAQVRKTTKGDDWRAPEKYDHFVITTLHRNATGDLSVDEPLMQELADSGYADGDGKLRRLPIHLLSDDLEDVVQAAYVWYGGKTVGGRSDGTKVTWFNDPKSGKRLDNPLEEDWHDGMLEYKDSKGNPLFKLHSIFNCVLSSCQGRWGGVYKFRTTSRITADQLYGSLLHLQQLTGDVLAGMPLQLVVRPMQVAPNGRPTTIYVVHVELRGEDMLRIREQALQLAQHRTEHRKLLNDTQIQYRKLLAPPGTETDPREIDDIAGEFHPETPNAGEEPQPRRKKGPSRLKNIVGAEAQAAHDAAETGDPEPPDDNIQDAEFTEADVEFVEPDEADLATTHNPEELI